MRHLQFATRAGSCGERNRQWSEATGSTDVLLEDDLEASIHGGDVGAIRLCAVSTGRHRILSDRRTGRPALKIVFQEQGECLFEQDGRSVLLRSGQWCAYDKNRPHHIRSHGISRQTALVLAMPRGNVVRPDWRVIRGGSYLTGAGSILHASTLAAVAVVDRLDEADAEHWEAIFLSLLGLALSQGDDEPVEPVRDRRRARVIEHVERHLEDPALDIASLASALCLSKRTLHKLFAEDGLTLTRLIWERRLERCRADLGNPALAHRTITDIALGWGFNDAQHFSRLFKTRFGARPSDVRSQHRLN